MGTSLLPLVCLVGCVAEIPVWAQPQRGPSHPEQVSPIQALALCSCHIGRVQPLHSLKGRGSQRLFCKACTLILQMSSYPSTLSNQVQLRPPPPFQEAIPDCAIILGTLVLLREAERRGGKKRERTPERERGGVRGRRKRQSQWEAWGGFSIYLTPRHTL